MKKYFICLTFFLAVLMGMNSSARAGNIFDIQRIRPIPNPVPGLIKGEDVLEITFILHAEGWVPGAGWTLRYYDKTRQWLATGTTAYFPASQNNTHLIRDGYFKGETVFVAIFPLDLPEAVYLVFALGDGFYHNVQLIPYTALLQDFNIPISQIDREILSSDYVVFGEEVENID